MSGRPWYRRYGGDFVMGTMALSLEEKGAYSLCLDLIYDRGGPIPDDARWLAGVCGVSVRKWTSLRAALIEAGKLVARDGCLTNSRAEIEIENAAKTARKLAENGAKGGNKRAEMDGRSNKNNGLDEAGLKPTCGLPEPEPEEETKTDVFVERASAPDRKPEKRERRASRMPADWQPRPEDVDRFKREMGATDGDIRREVAKAKDWSASHPNGAKKDHDAFFRNWMRSAAEARKLSGIPSRMAPDVSRQPAAAPRDDPRQWDEARWRRELAYARQLDRWPADMGPPPGQPGCLVPPSLTAVPAQGRAA
ncbi:hypothetical protein GCM10008171_32760 [Methylopila jiangsuensis]|uniref:DUF1376 domain-containing protein n=1 Tax=Methylopila jiangsuensis TaxID=586230 RepID=A0A9W6JJ84_9HYPH|nr:YdaU family protein [Methylopila jiangsuensis]MDR6284589.1 uncharacterized protein YdaU (DUF1376 family) [Methylopila jiangsuensis]GLK78022.1 hypothetical protein GCM10008171_32760 [Methylopila jiangsuensis]